METKTRKRFKLEWTGYASDEDIMEYMENYNENLAFPENRLNSFEEARDAIASDSWYWENEWENFRDCLQELMGDNVFWIDNATRMGWRSLSGYKMFRADLAHDFIDAITPKTSEFSLVIEPYYKGFKIRIGHHDAPMGEHHIVKPIKESYYQKYNS